MDNLARVPKEEHHAQIIRFVDLDKKRPGNWQYVDVDEFEHNIRQDEAAKWVALRKKERDRIKRHKEAISSMILMTTIVRVVATIIFAACVGLSVSIGNALLAICMFPFWCLFVILPGYNKHDDLIEKYEKYNKH